jgi:aerobic carbon-monoxide dehydrogenase large subunit
MKPKSRDAPTSAPFDAGWSGQLLQLLTASFMDYAMPRADTLCDMAITSNPVRTKLNPLGAKGAG